MVKNQGKVVVVEKSAQKGVKNRVITTYLKIDCQNYFLVYIIFTLYYRHIIEEIIWQSYNKNNSINS